ncbi:MAG: cation diffusion facilitator family transporter [Candidatus Diapherotrites archaeon]|nr:cation diffusion facilitator family transporter [Candidatus Diapherotrites archaeon]
MNKLKQGERAAAKVSVGTLILSLTKGIVGYITGSTALVTDAFHSLADLIAAASSWFGLKISQRKPDEIFPYGYYKAENLAGLVVALVILYAAATLLFEGFSRIGKPATIHEPMLAIATSIVSIGIAFLFYKYLKAVGEKINSPSLKANANDKLVDMASSSLVFIALVASYLNIPYIEGIVTVLISFLVMKIGLETAKDSVLALMDVSPSKDIEKRLESVLLSVKGVRKIKNLKLRKAGPFVFGDVEIEVKGSIDVKRAHSITEEIQKSVKRNIKEIEFITVHVEPHKPRRQKVVVPVENADGMRSKIVKHFGRARYFVLVELDNNKVKKHKVVKNPFIGEKIRAGLKTAGFLAEKGIDAVITKSIGEISFHTLRDHFVEIYHAKGENVDDTIKLFIRGKLRLLRRPTKEAGGIA